MSECICACYVVQNCTKIFTKKKKQFIYFIISHSIIYHLNRVLYPRCVRVCVYANLIKPKLKIDQMTNMFLCIHLDECSPLSEAARLWFSLNVPNL